MIKSGTLYIVATPIGNLEDITLRALRILKEVAFIAAEDTRHTLKLLNHFEIKTPLISLHEHNEKQKAGYITDRLQGGESCALVSDAGMPLISDPGFGLVELCRSKGISVTVCPGASAGLTALAMSGISCERFCFEGFLPANKKERRSAIKTLLSETRTIILYEAPHRIKTLLSELDEFSGRKIAAARELTKLHEELVFGEINELREHFEKNEPRGEFVIIIEGQNADVTKKAQAEKWQSMSIAEHVSLHIAQGLSESDAMKAAARDRNLPKREIYKVYKIQEDDSDNKLI